MLTAGEPPKEMTSTATLFLRSVLAHLINLQHRHFITRRETRPRVLHKMTALRKESTIGPLAHACMQTHTPRVQRKWAKGQIRVPPLYMSYRPPLLFPL